MRLTVVVLVIAILTCARGAAGAAPAPLIDPPPAIASVIDNAAKEFGVEPEVLYAIAQVESRFNPGAIAAAGYMGLFQLSPVYFKPPAGGSLLDPVINARLAAQFVRRLLDREGSVEGALRRYSATESTAAHQLELYRARKARSAGTAMAPVASAAPVHAMTPAATPAPVSAIAPQALETPPQIRPRPQ